MLPLRIAVAYFAGMENSILAGFVSSLRSTFVMLVYAEMYGSKYGMGFFVKKYTDFGLFNHAWVGFIFLVIVLVVVMQIFEPVSYTHLTLPTTLHECRSRWSPCQ